MPPSASSRTSSPPAPSTTTVSWNSASTRIRSAYSATGGRSTPCAAGRRCRAPAGRRSAVNSWTAHPVSRCTSSTSPWSSDPRRRRSAPASRRRPSPRSRARTASAAVATVLPTPVSVPVTTSDPHGRPYSLTTRPSTSTARAQSASVEAGVRGDPEPARSPSGHRRRPEAADPDAARRGRRPGRPARPAGDGIGTDSTAPAGGRSTPSAPASAAIRRCTTDGSAGLRRAARRSAAERAGRRGRREAGVEDERPGAVDQVLDERRGSRAPRRPGRRAPSTGSRSPPRERWPARPSSATRPRPPAPAHAEAVRLVDDQQRVVRRADLGQLDQRRGVAEHGVDRLGQHQRPPVAGAGERGPRPRRRRCAA